MRRRHPLKASAVFQWRVAGIFHVWREVEYAARTVRERHMAIDVAFGERAGGIPSLAPGAKIVAEDVLKTYWPDKK